MSNIGKADKGDGSSLPTKSNAPSWTLESRHVTRANTLMRCKEGYRGGGALRGRGEKESSDFGRCFLEDGDERTVNGEVAVQLES